MVAMSNTLRSIIVDPAYQDPSVVPVNVMNLLTSDATELNKAAANVADMAAKVIFDDSDAAFQQLDQATKAASGKLDQLAQDVANVNRVVSLLGAVIAFGTAAATGNVGTILTKASDLLKAASS
jgi:hypothetical protein